MNNFKISDELPYQAGKVTLITGKKNRLATRYPAIVFVTETSLSIALESSQEDKRITRGQLFLLPSNLTCTLLPDSDCEIIYLEIPDLSFLYLRNFSNSSKIKKVNLKELFSTLDIIIPLANWVKSISLYQKEKMNMSPLMGIKAMELIVLLKHYYSSEKVHKFFSPILSEDYKFALFVLTHYQHVSTSKELSALSNYSVTHFDRVFRKIFGQSAYQWMLQRKIQTIYAEVKNTSKPLKLIADQYGFASVANFGDFCRKHFGEAPSHIRKKIKQ